MSAHDLRFPRNADRWCGLLLLLVLALSCAVEKKMPEAPPVAIVGATVLDHSDRTVYRRDSAWVRIPGGGQVLLYGGTFDHYTDLRTTRGTVTVPAAVYDRIWQEGDSVLFPADRYVR